MNTVEAEELLELIEGTWPQRWDGTQRRAWIDALRSLAPEKANLAFQDLRRSTDQRPTIAELTRAAGRTAQTSEPGHQRAGPDAVPWRIIRAKWEAAAAAGSPDEANWLRILAGGGPVRTMPPLPPQVARDEISTGGW